MHFCENARKKRFFSGIYDVNQKSDSFEIAVYVRFLIYRNAPEKVFIKLNRLIRAEFR